MAATALLRAALTALEKHALLRLEATLALASGSRLCWHLLHLPIEFYTQRYAGEVGSRLAISDRVAQLVAGDLPAAVLNLFTALFFLAVMASYDPLLALVSLGFAAANICLLQAVARRRKAANQRLAIDGGKVMGAAMNGLMLIETLKASGAEADFFEKWSGYQACWLMSLRAQAQASLLLNALPLTFAALEAAAIVGLGGLRVMEGAMTLGMLVAFRIGQVICGAPLMPMSQALLLRVFPPEKRGMAMGIWGAVSGVATAVGPLLGAPGVAPPTQFSRAGHIAADGSCGCRRPLRGVLRWRRPYVLARPSSDADDGAWPVVARKTKKGGAIAAHA
jgi:ABC-type multidrug transport system fused ATPase/permease subunit